MPEPRRWHRFEVDDLDDRLDDLEHDFYLGGREPFDSDITDDDGDPADVDL